MEICLPITCNRKQFNLVVVVALHPFRLLPKAGNMNSSSPKSPRTEFLPLPSSESAFLFCPCPLQGKTSTSGTWNCQQLNTAIAVVGEHNVWPSSMPTRQFYRCFANLLAVADVQLLCISIVCGDLWVHTADNPLTASSKTVQSISLRSWPRNQICGSEVGPYPIVVVVFMRKLWSTLLLQDDKLLPTLAASSMDNHLTLETNCGGGGIFNYLDAYWGRTN